MVGSASHAAVWPGERRVLTATLGTPDASPASSVTFCKREPTLKQHDGEAPLA